MKTNEKFTAYARRESAAIDMQSTSKRARTDESSKFEAMRLRILAKMAAKHEVATSQGAVDNKADDHGDRRMLVSNSPKAWIGPSGTLRRKPWLGAAVRAGGHDRPVSLQVEEVSAGNIETLVRSSPYDRAIGPASSEPCCLATRPVADE